MMTPLWYLASLPEWWRRLKAAASVFVHPQFQVEPPKPPKVLRYVARDFPNYHPKATVGQWVGFSAKHAESAWMSGYRAGWEAHLLGQLVQDPELSMAVPQEFREEDMGDVVMVQGPERYQHATFDYRNEK